MEDYKIILLYLKSKSMRRAAGKALVELEAFWTDLADCYATPSELEETEEMRKSISKTIEHLEGWLE